MLRQRPAAMADTSRLSDNGIDGRPSKYDALGRRLLSLPHTSYFAGLGEEKLAR